MGSGCRDGTAEEIATFFVVPTYVRNEEFPQREGCFWITHVSP